MRLYLAVFALLSVWRTVYGGGEALNCFTCIGYKSDMEDNEFINNKHCPDANFQSDKVSPTPNPVNAGNWKNYVCGELYVNTPSVVYNNHEVFLRGKVGVNDTIGPPPKSGPSPKSGPPPKSGHTHPLASVMGPLTRALDDSVMSSKQWTSLEGDKQWFDPEGEVAFKWCSDNECNAGPRATPALWTGAALALTALLL